MLPIWREEQSFPRPLVWVLIDGALVPPAVTVVASMGRGSGDVIELTNGKRILIGSQAPEDLVAALDAISGREAQR